MNFHKLVEGSAQVQGPFKTRKEAEDVWRVVSEENRHKAGVRFSIVKSRAASSPEAPASLAQRPTASPDSSGGAVVVWRKSLVTKGLCAERGY